MPFYKLKQVQFVNQACFSYDLFMEKKNVFQFNLINGSAKVPLYVNKDMNKNGDIK